MRKMRSIVMTAAVTSLTIGVSVAQIIPAAQRMEAESELDRLSRNAEDEFPQLTIDENRTPVSVTFRALNKITARYIDIEAPMEEIAAFGTLEIVPRYCDKRPPEEFPETTAFLQIYDLGLTNDETVSTEEKTPADTGEAATEQVLQEIQSSVNDLPVLEQRVENAFSEDKLGNLSEGEKIFSGWMFASSPALNPLEHSVYDIWVIDCKTVVAAN